MDRKIEISTAEERERAKNHAVEVRESGDMAGSEELLKQVVDWDEANQNYRGQVDALGHLRIVYTKLAEEQSDFQVKQDFRTKARECVDRALVILDAHPEIPRDSRSTLQVHLASTIFDSAKDEVDTAAKTSKLTEALEVINQAMETLPGSLAHKAWPANPKAQISYELGQKDDAWEVLTQAEKWLYDGYEAEVSGGDQAELKLNVWLSGLMLTKAEICRREGKPILARHYAEYVVNMTDPHQALGQRKKDATKILATIK